MGCDPPMELEIRLFASLRERAGAEQLRLVGLPAECTVAQAKGELEQRHPELGSLGHVRGVLGTRYVPDGTVLDGQEPLHLLPPVSGG